MRTPSLVDPWRSFLHELDQKLSDAVDIHCIGGFFVGHVYGLGRAISDLDFVYESRLRRICKEFRRLRLHVLEPHDLALSKLERSAERVIQDVMHLSRRGLIRREDLVDRYKEELRPYLAGKTPTWNDATLRMWVEACWPDPV